METDNQAANMIMNETEEQKISRDIDMKFYWVHDRIRQNNFHILWEEGNENLVDYVTKHQPLWHHRTMQPRYLKAKTKKETKKTGKMEPEEGVMEISIPG